MTSDRTGSAIVRAARREAGRCSCGRPIAWAGCWDLLIYLLILAFEAGFLTAVILEILR